MALMPRLSSVLTTPAAPGAGPLGDIAITVGTPSDIAALDGDVVSGHAAALARVMQSDRQDPAEGRDAWSQIEAGQWWRGLLQRDRITEFPGHFAEWLRAIWTGSGTDLAPWLEGQSADAVLVQPDMSRPGQLWLLLEPDGDHRAIVASLAEIRDGYQGPHGQISLFSADRGWQSWEAPNRPLLLGEPLTIANARTVIGNYVTMIPGRYIGPILILSAVCAILAFGIAVLTRRKRG